MSLLLSLERGLNRLNLDTSVEQREKLLSLLEQLLKWNKAYNLTAITDSQQALTLHLLDSLAVTPHIQSASVLDVGTGPGFPGLPLAIMLPEVKFTLVDANSKKIRFIRQQIHELKLKNVVAEHTRIEKKSGETYPCIISRAFASVNDMLSWTSHLLAPDGVWLAMKGVYSSEETANLIDGIRVISVDPVLIPGLDAERCLIKLSR